MTVRIPTHLTNEGLLAAVPRLAVGAQQATAELVAHLAELDARRLYLGLGFASLFSYCCDVLHLAEHEAYNRIEAARTARRLPVVLEYLANGRVTLTTVRLLAPHLTEENHRTLLDEASHLRKLEVLELIARRAPRPDVPASVRKVPVRADRGAMANARADVPPAAPLDAPVLDLQTQGVPAAGVPGPLPTTERTATPTVALAPPPLRRPVVTPLAADRYEFRFTAGAATRDKLRRAQDLLRHAVPDGSPAEVFDRALTALLEQLERRKTGAPRANARTQPAHPAKPVSPGSREVPAAVKREVWARDGGQCAFVGSSGHRCRERAFLEYHHVTPWAAGGKTTAANIELRCRAHNGYEAERYFGIRFDALRRGDAGDSFQNESKVQATVRPEWASG